MLQQKQITPPYKPALRGERDLEHFDPAFTNEPVQLTPDDPYVIIFHIAQFSLYLVIRDGKPQD